jgi:hypothetical protein
VTRPSCGTCRHNHPGVAVWVMGEGMAWRDFPEWGTCIHPLMRENEIHIGFRFMPLAAVCGLHEPKE